MMNLFLRLTLITAISSHASLLTSQNLFVQKMLDCPGTRTVGARTVFADMDKDGDEDLAGPDIDGSTLLIYRNQNGAIDTFPQRIQTILPKQEGYPSDFFLTDWNLDGLPDWIQVQGKDNGYFYLFLNLGGFKFAKPVLLFTHYAYNVQASFGAKDMNNDGYPDVYAIAESLQICLNNGGQPAGTMVSGAFLGEPVFSPGTALDGVFLDYDGNGTLDFVGMEWVSAPTETHLMVFQNLGNFQFSLAEVLWDTPWLINAADLNNDGADEVLFMTQPGAQFHAMTFNAASQTWEDKPIGSAQFASGGGFYGNNNIPWTYPVADMDGNGFRDIVIGNHVFFNNGNFQFTKTQLSANPNYAFPSLITGDPDMNGKMEIWWATEEVGEFIDPAGVFRFEYAGGQAFKARERMWRMYPWFNQDAGAGRPSMLFDCNLDNQPDLVYFSNGGVVLSINHNGVFTEKLIAPAPCAHCLLSFRQMDVDGDNQRDLIILGDFGTSWLKKTGPESYSPGGYFQYPGLPWQAFPVAFHDFDKDGLADLIVISAKDGVNRWAFAKNSGNGIFQVLDEGAQGMVLPSVAIDDFNGDGYDDFMFYKDNALVFLNEGGAGFTQSDAGGGEVTCGLADVTADGKKDMIFLEQPDIFQLKQNTFCRPSNGDGTFGAPVLLDEGAWRGDVNHAIFDVNNDGLDDLVSNWNLLVALNHGTGFGPSVYQGDFYASEDNFNTVYDFDGDGDLDISNIYPVSFWENVTNGSYRIHGQVFFDKNGNGQQDPGELPLAGIKAGVSSLQSFAVSDSSGRFVIPAGRSNGPFEVPVYSSHLASFEFTTPYPPVSNVSETQPEDTVRIGVRVSGGAKADLDMALSSHRCNETARLWLSFTPVTAGPAQGELRLKFPEGLAVSNLDSLPGVVVAGQEIRWPLTQLPTLAAKNVWVDFLMPGFEQSGGTLFFAAELSLHNGTDSSVVNDTLFSKLTCAYDPNDKQIANIERFLAGDEYYTTTVPDRVEYVVRFQNTGNDTAFQVTILDNLSPVFDYNSFRVLSASHPYGARLDANGLLRVEFADIALPDSATDFMGSMGYVKFAISLNPDPPRLKPIVNGARILFDYNPPVYTNLTRFHIVDCSFFAQWSALPYPTCEGDSFQVFTPDFGFPQTWLWTHNDVVISQTDSAWVPVTGIDNVVGLRISNALCTVDTSFYFHSNGAYPDLQLSLDSSITICAGHPIEITSNIHAQWYRNDTLVSSGIYYTAYTTQNLRVVSALAGVPCISKKSVGITAAPVPDRLIQEGEQGHYILRCAGDSIHLSTNLPGQLHWTVTDFTTTDTFQTPEVSFPVGVFQLVAQLRIDTLNCALFDARTVQLIPSGTMELWGDSIVCEYGNVVEYALTIDGQTAPFDSLFLYQDSLLIDVVYFGSWASVQPGAGGEYSIAVFSACLTDTFHRTIRYFPDLPPVEIVKGADTLFTNNGQKAFWYFAPSPDSFFNALFVETPGIGNPPDGYYYVLYQLGNCFGFSDTVYFQTSGILAPGSGFQTGVSPNPTSGAICLTFPDKMQQPGVIQFLDLHGRIVQTETLPAGTQKHFCSIATLPAGIYFVNVLKNGGERIGLQKVIKK